jgi:hypothetical protein
MSTHFDDTSQNLGNLVAAEISQHRMALSECAKSIDRLPIDAGNLVRISTLLLGCRLILDKAMNAVWSKHGVRQQRDRKPNIYFPCVHNLESLNARLKSYSLHDLKSVNRVCYLNIQGVQPFMAMQNRWLGDLFSLTKDRHENYLKVSKVQESSVQIGYGQSGTIKSISFNNDGTLCAVSDMRNSQTGEHEPLMIAFSINLRNVLTATGDCPVNFSAICLDNVEATFFRIFETLS